MAVTLIGEILDQQQTVEHEYCNAVVAFYYTDLLQDPRTYTAAGGSPLTYYIVCPKCGLHIPIKKRVLPVYVDSSNT